MGRNAGSPRRVKSGVGTGGKAESQDDKSAEEEDDPGGRAALPKDPLDWSCRSMFMSSGVCKLGMGVRNAGNATNMTRNTKEHEEMKTEK